MLAVTKNENIHHPPFELQKAPSVRRISTEATSYVLSNDLTTLEFNYYQRIIVAHTFKGRQKTKLIKDARKWEVVM